MKYLLLICTDGPVDADEAELDPTAWVEENDSRGVRLLGERLRPAADATAVRVRGGDVLVTDGPFAEAREQLGGFDIIECADLDEAVGVAAGHPMARFGVVEVWPFWTP
ncbi:YciI family protein [Kitasatospora paranensis]|uniref:YciI family protein n=1 Tax=Kitasatospora paranensis TaxID=258053 RepID=A0ABW2FLL6_9ACTN